MIASLRVPLVWGLCVVGGAAQAEPPRFDATKHYRPRSIEGFPVLVHERFFAEHGDPAVAGLGEQALAELRHQLFEIKRHVPVAAVEKLQTTKIWVEFDEPHHPCLVYHPDAGWLRQHGMNPEKARSVEIANAEKFVSWSLEQPWMVLHELAHAYQHQFFDATELDQLIAAWQQAKRQGRYDSVLNIQGRKVRHYALATVEEYFAEGSESFFGTNDYFPFVRAELAEHDPTLYALLNKTWHKGEHPQQDPAR